MILENGIWLRDHLAAMLLCMGDFVRKILDQYSQLLQSEGLGIPLSLHKRELRERITCNGYHNHQESMLNAEKRRANSSFTRSATSSLLEQLRGHMATVSLQGE